MRARCNNPNKRNYKDYGGRGIVICERWNDFSAFLADMGAKPHGTSLDRIDNNGPYSPENCKWSTSAQQNRNRRDNKLTIDKVRHIREQIQQSVPSVIIAAQLGVSESTISHVKAGRTWATQL